VRELVTNAQLPAPRWRFLSCKNNSNKKQNKNTYAKQEQTNRQTKIKNSNKNQQPLYKFFGLKIIWFKNKYHSSLFRTFVNKTEGIVEIY